MDKPLVCPRCRVGNIHIVYHATVSYGPILYLDRLSNDIDFENGGGKEVFLKEFSHAQCSECKANWKYLSDLWSELKYMRIEER